MAKKFNKELKELAKLANVAKSVSSYTLRHSYATNLKQLGVSTEKISESLGHSNVDITNSYLKLFETEEIDIENEKLYITPEPSSLWGIIFFTVLLIFIFSLFFVSLIYEVISFLVFSKRKKIKKRYIWR